MVPFPIARPEQSNESAASDTMTMQMEQEMQVAPAPCSSISLPYDVINNLCLLGGANAHVLFQLKKKDAMERKM